MGGESETQRSKQDHKSPSKRFHGVHPLKRFKMIQQEETQKKIKKSNIATAGTIITTYCLPAKKRIWALQHATSPPDSPSPKRLYCPSDSPISRASPLRRKPTFTLSPKREEEEKQRPDLNEVAVLEDDDDDGIVCSVCKSTDGEPTDPIVLCDGCDVMVHASCYGSPLVYGIPDGDWFCAKCQLSGKGKEKPQCCLCPVEDGALKPTTDGRWAHILCALLVPEVFFRDSAGRDSIDCSNVPDRRWGGNCYICSVAKGCVIECSEPRCSETFHASCGLEHDLHLEYREERATGIVVAFCKLHSLLWKKQQQTGKFKIVPRVQAKGKAGTDQTTC